MTDPFTSASPTYIAAQRTNQAKGQGWCFSPDPEEPIWLKAITEIFRPRSLFIFAVIAGVLSLFWI